MQAMKILLTHSPPLSLVPLADAQDILVDIERMRDTLLNSCDSYTTTTPPPVAVDGGISP